MVNAVRASTKKRRRRTSIVGDRDGWICWICNQAVVQGLPANDLMHASLDHVIPRSLGGSNGISNLRLSHHKCNHERDAQQSRAPWALEQGRSSVAPRGPGELRPTNPGSPARAGGL